MPVKFLSGDFHSYNKGQPIGKPKPPFDVFPTVVELSNSWVARVSVPLPDKVRLTIDIHQEIYGATAPANLSVAEWVKATGDYLKNQPFNSQHLDSAYNPSWKYPYRFVELGLGKREAMVRFDFHRPKANLAPRLWITMNPRKLGPAGFKGLLAILSDPSGPFAGKPLLQSARVTKLEVAVDIVGLQTSDMVLFHPNAGKRQHYVGEDDVLETVYLHRKSFKSKPAGAAFLKVYDRRRERIFAGKKPPFGSSNITRVEVTKQHKKPHNSLAKIGEFTDPFKGARVGFVCDQQAVSRRWLSYHTMCRTIESSKAASMLGLTSEERSVFDNAFTVPENPLVAEHLNWAGWNHGLKLTGLALLVDASKE